MTVSDLRRGAVLLSCVTQASYTYDTSGNRKSETDLDGKITSYAYDGLGRLTQESETNGRTIGYTYDAAGNRTQMTVSGTESYVTAYTYDANNRLLTETKTQNSETTATTYTYDANGNTLSKSVQQGSDPAEITAYTYDRFNQLVSVTADGIPVYYSYNAEGIRTAKLSCGILTSFLLDGGDVAAELQNDVLQASYLRGINLICREQGGEKEYYLFDAHADVIALTDEDGEITKSYDYDAFGCETQPDPLDANPFRYCGEYFDIETGSYYLRARYYAPAIGRFTQQDTHWTTANMIYGDNPQKINEREDALGLKNYTYVPQITAVMQAGNQYVYGINDPIMYFDYTGQSITLICVLICAGIGAAVGGYLGNSLANEKGISGTRKVIYISAGILFGGSLGAVAGYGVGQTLTVLAAEASSCYYGTLSGTIGAELLNSWQSAEQFIRNQIGSVMGYADRVMYTPYGTRVVDAYNEATNVIAEVKYGYMTLNSFIRSEIEKDYYLLSSGDVKSVEWHFFQSAQTGRIGGSSALIEELLKRGFDVIFH